MAGSANEHFSVVDERASDWTDTSQSIFANANNREPFLHWIVPSPKSWSKSQHSHQLGQCRLYYNW
jgi:hypothetical protein